jgi:hypothetical protein
VNEKQIPPLRCGMTTKKGCGPTPKIRGGVVTRKVGRRGL